MKRKNKRGVTLVELMIGIVIMGIMSYGIYRVFRDFYKLWWMSERQIDVQQKARASMDEMTRSIREADPVTGLVIDQTGPMVGGRITFTDPDGKSYQYYKSGSKLYRNVGGSTSEMINDYLTGMYFVLDSTEMPKMVRIASMTVTRGGYSITLDRNVYLRNN